MNSVQLVGRLARAPSVRFEGEGTQVTIFTLMIEEPGRGEQSWRLFVPCTSYGRSAETASLLHDADLVAVQGRLGWQKRTAQCGQEHSMLVVRVQEVQVLQDTATLTGKP